MSEYRQEIDQLIDRVQKFEAIIKSIHATCQECEEYLRDPEAEGVDERIEQIVARQVGLSKARELFNGIAADRVRLAHTDIEWLLEQIRS